MNTNLIIEQLVSNINVFTKQIESLKQNMTLLQQQSEKILPEIKLLKEAIEQSHVILEELQIAQEKLCQPKHLAHRCKTQNIERNRYLSQDISDFKQVEKKLLEKEELLELVLNNIPQAIFWKDTNSIYLGCNKTWAKTVGITNVQDVVGKTDYDIPCNQKIGGQYIEQDRRVVNTGISELHTIEQRLQADGKPVWIDVSKIPIHDHEGKIIGILGMWEDITERKQAEEALHKSEARNQALLNAIPDIMVRMSRDGIFLDFRPAKNFNTIMPSSEIMGKSLYEVMPLEIAQQRMQYIEQALETGCTQIYEFQLVNDGNVTYEEARIVVSGQDEVIAIVRDITERKQTEAALQQVKEKYRKSEQQFRAIFENAAIGIGLTDPKGLYITTNPALQKMLGYSNKELCNMSFAEVTHPNNVAVDVELYKELVAGRLEHYQIEKCYCCKNGQSVWGRIAVSSIRDNRNKLQFTVAVVEDITERKQAEEKLLHNAFHDVLTNLPNRALFLDRLNSVIKHTQRCEGYLFAVLFLDLDRFKNINDSLGHLFGDQMLVAIARKLEASLRTGDMVARLGGDEFAILLEDLKSVSDSICIAERIQKEVSLPLNLDGCEVFTNVSIGIALSSTGYEQPEEILRDADTAMYQAKALGKARYEVFDKDMHIRAVALLQLETDLQRAIERQEFVLHYQPILSLKTNQIVGFEALSRWQHPERGLIFPKDFISVAEETGLISLLGWWVLREACRQLRVWQIQFPSNLPLTISVNLSGKQFSQPDLVERIAEILRETSLDASSLKLEITESAIMTNVESASAMLGRLKHLGVHLHMDDFGTGYSSLNYLRCFPIDTLKIDRSFVNQMSLSNENLEIVRTIIVLAHNLGIEAVAEGVETVEHVAQLKSLQCDYGQGYFFSKPVELETAQLLITKYKVI